MKAKILIVLFFLNLGVIHGLSSKECTWDCTVTFSMDFQIAYTTYENTLKTIAEQTLSNMYNQNIWGMYSDNNQVQRAEKEFNLTVSTLEYRYCDCGCCNY